MSKRKKEREEKKLGLVSIGRPSTVESYRRIESQEPGTPAPALLKGGEEIALPPYRIIPSKSLLDGLPTFPLLVPAPK